MKIIDMALENIMQFPPDMYSKMDIMKFMCPVELGLAEFDCNNEQGNRGLDGCINCWNREYIKS
jgi:hypothetical protein